MKSIFDFNDFHEFLVYWLAVVKAGQRGVQRKLADAAGISSTMMSLIIKGDKQLNPEQAYELCEFMGLNDREADYFLLLVDLARCGSHKLKIKLKKKIQEAQLAEKNLSKRLKKDKQLSEEQVSIFYSQWIYAAASLACALPNINDNKAIAEKFNISQAKANKIIEFLLEAHLCERKNGQLNYGQAYTHIGSDSPNVVRHHQNWRIKAMNSMDHVNDKQLFYTGPFALSHEAAEQIRKLLPGFIEQVVQIAGPSKSETLYCFNLDWFEF